MLDEEIIFALFEVTPDLVCIVDREGYFKRINSSVGKTLGYSPEELTRSPVSTFIHPEDKERTAANRGQLLSGKPLLNFQNRYLTKKGAIVWLEWTSVYIPQNERVFAIAKNVTRGKLMEMEVIENLESLKKLNRLVKQHTEKHRQKIAGTLHEDMSQIAAAIKLKIEWVASEERAVSQHHQELLLQTLNSTGHLLDKLRALLHSLNPSTLYIQGLNQALRALCYEFAINTKITCTYKSRYSKISLSEEEMLDAHWICREALQNVQEHAAASEVTVFLRKTKRGLLVSICDNGNGFDYASKELSGISVMKARALSIQAELTIESDSHGTTISLLMKRYVP